MILVDSNVIIDVLTKDPVWQAWSEAALAAAADRGEVAINPIIYAEIASGFATVSELDRHVGANRFRRLARTLYGRICRRPGVCRISQARWRADITASGFLYRCPCRSLELEPSHA